MTSKLFPKEEVSFIFVFTIVVSKCIGQGLLNTVFHFTFKWHFTYIYIYLRLSATSQVKNHLKVGVARCWTFFSSYQVSRELNVIFGQCQYWNLSQTSAKVQIRWNLHFFAGFILLQMDVTMYPLLFKSLSHLWWLLEAGSCLPFSGKILIFKFHLWVLPCTLLTL